MFSKNIRSFFIPQILDSEGSLVYFYLSSSTGPKLSCKSKQIGIPNDNPTSKIQKFNSTSVFFGIPYSNTKAYFGILNCETGKYIKEDYMFFETMQVIVSFIPNNSNNISILFYDGKNNTLRTYQPDNFNFFEENNYTTLLGSINYGYSYALEDGGFIFCYNSSLTIDSIICETMKFVDSKLTNEIQRTTILTCPSPWD